jgi:hypothetical protein
MARGARSGGGSDVVRRHARTPERSWEHLVRELRDRWPAIRLVTSGQHRERNADWQHIQ